MTKKIDPKLPVFTRDGRPVQLITMDGRSEFYPILGYIGESEDIRSWTIDGKRLHHNDEPDEPDEPDPLDLIQDREVWVNIYEQEFLAVFPTKEAAQRSHKAPIARVRVPYTPGQFDD